MQKFGELCDQRCLRVELLLRRRVLRDQRGDFILIGRCLYRRAG